MYHMYDTSTNACLYVDDTEAAAAVRSRIDYMRVESRYKCAVLL